MPSVETNSQLRQVLSWDVRALDAVGVHVKMSDSAMIDAALDVRITGQSTKSRIALSTVGWSTTGAYIDSISGSFPAIAANGEGNILLNTSTIDHVDLYVATLGESRIFVNSEEGSMSNFTLYEGDAGVTKVAGVGNPLPVALQHPLVGVTPDVGGSPQSMQEFGDGTNDVFYLRLTANAGDDIIAGMRLSNGYPDVTLILPDSQTFVRSSSAITRIDVCAFGDTESGTPAAGEIATEASTEANVRALSQTFTFDSAQDVRTVVLTATNRYSAGTAGAPAATANYVRLLVEGRSNV